MRRHARLKVRSRTREGVVVVAMATFLSFGLLQIGGYVEQRQRSTVGRHAVAVVPSDDGIYTGSILFTPIVGKICHEFLFDNRTGRINDKGKVDCERALHSADPKNWGFPRARAIANSFRDR
jgi:hypothetical protein